MSIEMLTMTLGGLVGGILGLTGAGGSIIAVPLLIFCLQLSAVDAAPIALFAVAISSFMGALVGLKQQQVRYRAAGLIAIAGVCIAPIGVWLAGQISNGILTVIFAAVLLFVAIRMLGQSEQVGTESLVSASDWLPCQVKASEVKISWTMRCVRALAYTGALVGLLSGLLGVGGGFVVVPALKKYSNLGMMYILPTSLAVIALISTAGILSAIGLDRLNYKIAWPFALGSMVGMLFSMQLAKYCSAMMLQRIFASFSMLIAVSLIVKVVLI